MAKKKEKTAQWVRVGIGDEERFQCSECDMIWFLAYGTPIENEMFYCPRCGSKMTDGSVK